MIDRAIPLLYLTAAVSFVLALKWLSAVPTARRGVVVGAAGMALAVAGTLLKPEIESYRWIAVAFVAGTVIGVPMAMMPMTAVPQRTALSHAFGALAAALVGTAEFYLRAPAIDRFTMGALVLEVLLGFLTFTASLMAFGKLQEILPTRPITWRSQNIQNFAILGLAVASGAYLVARPDATRLFPLFGALALVFGVMLIIPIGGAIIAGALDGSSGLILSVIMCRAMNRSFTNVLFGAFGQVQATVGAAGEQRAVRSATPEEAAGILQAASRVIVVPGYGMAVAQAQHKVRELYDVLMKAGVDVRFAIHPVAGRMPGHMNVLLAEANIPYDRLVEMEEVNSDFAQADVALVIGANDVTNPAARHDRNSPIYGMPILDVDKARTVMVIKRSMSPGFAGIDNELYSLDRTLMVFGDAKAVVGSLVKEFAGGA
ncbi:MAG: transhydrogenase, beta subunit [Deltaproteobacteria bacterium]|nr:transhydrogenase, beta subunit [Deltaproteobacteria bacterium]